MDEGQEGGGEGLSLRFAVVLAAALLGLVLLLNVLGSAEVPVPPEYVQRFEKEGMIEAVHLAPGGWHLRLKRPTRVDNGGGEIITREVVVKGQGEPQAEMVANWRLRGIAVEIVPDPEPRSGWVGGLLLAALLGLGIWHLWQQMQKHRREGSPRQHLEALERDLKEGKITPEQFQVRADLIMAEM